METLILVVAILCVGAITPGPNNFMVMAAGARGGLPAAGPVIGGVVLGGLVLLTLAWSGVAAVLENDPRLRLVLTSAGALYLVWHGGGMIRAAPCLGLPARGGRSHGSELPCGWIGVALFQLLNPKAWVLLLTAAAAMSRAFEGARGLGALAAIYAVRSACSLTVWAVLGSAIGRVFGDGSSRCWFERAMGGLLVALAILLMVGEL